MSVPASLTTCPLLTTALVALITLAGLSHAIYLDGQNQQCSCVRVQEMEQWTHLDASVYPVYVSLNSIDGIDGLGANDSHHLSVHHRLVKWMQTEGIPLAEDEMGRTGPATMRYKHDAACDTLWYCFSLYVVDAVTGKFITDPMESERHCFYRH